MATIKTPELQVISQAWAALREAVGVTSIRSESDYLQVRAVMEALLDVVGNDEDHPLADLLDYLGEQIEAYEEEQYPTPDAEPREVLRFLMEQHELKQEDLADCAPQNRISDILNGKRAISKEIAKKLARRFHVHADVFL